jgi:hypothetical protein
MYRRKTTKHNAMNQSNLLLSVKPNYIFSPAYFIYNQIGRSHGLHGGRIAEFSYK